MTGALSLPLGREAVLRLLPHRPPLLLVDGVDDVRMDPPSLRAHRHISPDEPVLTGHFPDRPIWPGVYTIEGLAQACALLAALRGEGPAPFGVLLAGVEVKLTAPVLPGDRLEYHVAWTHSVPPVHRFSVAAEVGRRTVARGVLLLAEAPPP